MTDGLLVAATGFLGGMLAIAVVIAVLLVDAEWRHRREVRRWRKRWSRRRHHQVAAAAVPPDGSR